MGMVILWNKNSKLDCHATARGVKTKFHVLRKGHLMGVPSLIPRLHGGKII